MSKSLRVVDVRAFGSWMSAPKCLFFQDFEHPDRSFGPGLSTLTEVLGRDIRANDPRMSAGYPSQKLTLWADFSFLNMEKCVLSAGKNPMPIKFLVLGGGILGFGGGGGKC